MIYKCEVCESRYKSKYIQEGPLYMCGSCLFKWRPFRQWGLVGTGYNPENASLFYALGDLECVLQIFEREIRGIH